jgi:cell division protein FtsZ
MLTERVDPKAVVIWGARVDPTFENKIEVITVFTGVHSPYIKGEAPTTTSKVRARGDLDIGSL